MLSKRRKTLSAVLLCVIFVAVGVALSSRNDEPRYKGKTLSEWMAVWNRPTYPQQGNDLLLMIEAVQVIGTNALPHYLKWIRYEPPAWRRTLKTSLPRWLWSSTTFQGLIPDTGAKRAQLAGIGLGILGSNANAALPELEVLMKDSTKPKTSISAISAMGFLGESAIPVLRAALWNTNQINRAWIIEAFATIADNHGTNIVLPHLLEALAHDDAEVRTDSTNAIQRIAPETLANRILE